MIICVTCNKNFNEDSFIPFPIMNFLPFPLKIRLEFSELCCMIGSKNPQMTDFEAKFSSRLTWKVWESREKDMMGSTGLGLINHMNVSCNNGFGFLTLQKIG